MDKIIDRSNMYEIQDYWINNIAPKYFDMKDINLNRSGLFGYVNEIESHSVESIINENSILYNELFFKRAQLPETIYAYASQYDVSDTSAKPSIMQFGLILNEQTLIEKSFNNSSNQYFIIDADSEIMVKDTIPFMLDYDIQINIRKNEKGEYNYVARYLTTTLGNPISSITTTSNPYIKTAKIKYNRINYLVLYVDCHQVSKTVKTQNIYSENIIDYFNFQVNNDSVYQIADFSVYYKKPNGTDYEQIEKILIDKKAIDNKFCYYQFKDNNLENEVSISFSTISRYFQPEFNSELKFVFFNTMGESGSFEYIGNDVTMILKSEKYDYRDMIINVVPISNSVGGRDALSYDGIKDQVSIMSSTCNVLGTQIDLDKYFSNLEMQSKITFIKKEDDVLRRMYGAYTMFKDNFGNIVPTNTLDIDIYEEDFDLIEPSTKRYVLRAGDKFIYQPNSRRLKKLKKDDNLLFEPKFIYTNPFTIIINRSEFFTSYFLTSVNNSYNPDYTMINESCYMNFIMNNIKIERNSLETDTYVITFDILPASEDEDMLFANLNEDDKTFVSDNNKMCIKGMMNDEDGNITHYFNCSMIDCISSANNENSDDLIDDAIESSTKPSSSIIYKFKAEIKTDDYISTYSNLRTISGVYDAKDRKKKNPLIDATKLNMTFGVFIKDHKENNDIYHQYMDGLDGYTISNIFTIPEPVALITDMNRLMYSTVLYKYDENDELYYRIREVPFVKSEYLSINKYALSFYRDFFSDYLVLKNNLERLTNAFNINMKLYNTYGKSYYFYVNEKKSNTLDEVNLTISFRIKLNPNKLSDYMLKNDIKNFIKEYTENINDNSDLDLYVSNIITALEDRYTDIVFINFKYINNYNSSVQSIEKNFPTARYEDKNKIPDFVPEYLNINKTFIDEFNTNEDVIIEFV